MSAHAAPLLQTGDYMPVVYYFYERADMPGTTPYETRHSHSLYEIMYVSEGETRVEAGGQEVLLRRGQYVWLNASAPHALYVPSGAPLSMLNIEYQFERRAGACPSTKEMCALSPAFERLMAEQAPCLVLGDRDGAAALYLRQIIRWAERGGEGAGHSISALLMQMLLHMAVTCGDGETMDDAADNAYVSAALKRIENDYPSPLTARQIAQELFISPSYLHQLFRAHTGLTVREHLRRRRIRQARLLLARGDMPIAAVADAVGVRSVRYFTKLFSQHVGVTPAEYRQRPAK